MCGLLQAFIIFFLPGLMLVNAAIVKLKDSDAEALHEGSVHGGCVKAMSSSRMDLGSRRDGVGLN